MPIPEDTPKTRSRFELVIALLLGLAAVLTAVASFQGALRSGDSLKAFNEGIRSVNDANGYYNEAAQVSRAIRRCSSSSRRRRRPTTRSSPPT